MSVPMKIVVEYVMEYVCIQYTDKHLCIMKFFRPQHTAKRKNSDIPEQSTIGPNIQ